VWREGAWPGVGGADGCSSLAARQRPRLASAWMAKLASSGRECDLEMKRDAFRLTAYS